MERSMKAHLGFKAVAAKIQKEYPGEPGAGARIAAAAARKASPAAVKANPRLKKVRGHPGNKYGS